MSVSRLSSAGCIDHFTKENKLIFSKTKSDIENDFASHTPFLIFNFKNR
ncbi:hypothetical protein HMPREF0621_0041 [Pasteurella dagmatis ATCC 43325]|uniref:Uncharacterized protein n=1 Tax=Pasteurella dagmatis ATCC 43325 TaxID=667128 RepID=C9PM17_9PAST|nr:hypothetical protein HMPREF0621_0041 [Pasteurella dagmatis ATCC 43325]